MDQNNLNFLLEYNLQPEDIDQICTEYPGIIIADTQRIIKNINLLIQFGYPKLDLDSIIMINPKFLLSDHEDLIKKLIAIGENVEEKLKENPFLI